MQPDNLTATVVEFGVAVVMRRQLMRLEVPMRDDVRLIGVRFVQMLWRKSS